MHGSTLVAVSFVLYAVGVVIIGFIAATRHRRGNEDYFLASRELGPWLTAISACATAESGWVMLGLVGVAFSSGISALWLIPGCAVGYLFNFFWVARRLRHASDATGAVTLPEYLGERFQSDAVRVIAVLIITIAMLGYVSAQLNALGKAFHASFDLPYEMGVVIGTALLLFYTTHGGFRAEVWTDFIQGILMVTALLVLPVLVVVEAGGINAVVTSLKNQDPNIVAMSGGKAGFAFLGLVMGWLGIGLGYPGQPHVLARFMATRDDKSVRVAGIVAFIWSTLVFLGAIGLGLGCRALFGTLADPEQALPLVAMKLLPSLLAGLVLAAVWGAITTTADSQLLILASAIAHDVYRGLMRRTATLTIRPRSNPHDGGAMDSAISALATAPGLTLITDHHLPVAEAPGLARSVTVRATSARDLVAWIRRVRDPRLEIAEHGTDWLNRTLVVVLGLIAMVAALSHNRVIFEFVLYAWSALGAAFGPVLILALSWRRMTKTGAIAGMVTGAAVTVIWKNTAALSAIVYELVPAFVCAFIAAIVASRISGRGLRRP